MTAYDRTADCYWNLDSTPYTAVPTEIIMFIQLKPFLSLFYPKNFADKASFLYFVPAQFTHLTFPNAFFNAKIYIPVKNMKGSTGKIKQEKKTHLLVGINVTSDNC